MDTRWFGPQTYYGGEGMKNGIETRVNGSLIVKTKRQGSIPQYHVFKRNEDGDLVKSINGPFDHLWNARMDSNQ